MSAQTLEIRRWYCDMRGCEAQVMTLGSGYPAGWVTTGASGLFGEESFCSEEHARQHAARRVRINDHHGDTAPPFDPAALTPAVAR